VNFGRGAPARQLVPELPEHDLPVTPGSAETPQASGQSVAYLRRLWEHRGRLARVIDRTVLK
jgi:hypothetical protein